MSNTAPFLLPIDTSTPTENSFEFDHEKIMVFNNKISICSTCENCNEKNNIPHCNLKDLPLTVIVETQSCPIGKW